MPNLTQLHKLAGQKLLAIHLVQEYHDDTPRPFNTALLLSFEKFNCLIQAVAADDTILCKTGKDLEWGSSGKPKIVDVSNSRLWKECIGKTVLWAWQLTNQQGYEDGIQICFHERDTRNSEVIRQVMVRGSQVEVYEVEEKLLH